MVSNGGPTEGRILIIKLHKTQDNVNTLYLYADPSFGLSIVKFLARIPENRFDSLLCHTCEIVFEGGKGVW